MNNHSPAGLSRQYIAEDLGIDPRTVDSLIKKGSLSAFHVGRNVRVCADSYKAFLMQSKANYSRVAQERSDAHPANKAKAGV